MITMATWEESLQPSRHSHAESPVTLATQTLLHNHGHMRSVCCCRCVRQRSQLCVDALPLGPFIEAGASGSEWALLVAVIEWQQGVWAQTLRHETQKHTIAKLKCS